MALDGIAVAGLVCELNRHLAGARISKVAQPESDEILLTVKGNAGNERLLLSASASLPLAYLTSKNKPSPLTAPPFCMLLRKHIGSGRILAVTQPSLERVIHIEIEHYNDMGDLCRSELILELMGKHSNLIFVNSEGMILDAIKHIGAQTSSVREVLPGRDYFLPLTQDKADPLTVSGEEFRARVFSKPQPLAKALYTSLTGISPCMAEELCFRASLGPETSAREITEGGQYHLQRIFGEMADSVKRHDFSPNIVYGPSGTPVEFAALPLTMYADAQVQTFDSMSAVLETYYAQKSESDRIRQKSSDLRRIVTTALERESKKLDLQQKQLKDTEKREKFRIYGELLHTYGYSAEPGADSVTVPNYYDEDRELKIPLDPTLTASENAKRYFDRYAKLKRTEEALTELTAETQSAVDQLTEIRSFLGRARTEAELSQIREELTQAGIIRRHAAPGRKGAARPAVSKPYHYVTADGYDIYVGKNNLQNDELTFKFASGGDWWFHAKKIPGSHVVVKSKGTELPDSVFEDAARLAAYYSDGRASDKVEIDYVQRREVKKPAGARPGYVIYYTNYSMVARPDLTGLTLAEA